MRNYAGGLPIYLQIAYQIRDDIINRKYEVNAQIPAEEELASIYGVSRMTARNAVTYLVNKGLVYRVHERDACVSVQQLNRNLNKLNNFKQDMKALGMRPASNILEFLRRLPTQREQQLLHIHKNQEVFNVKCMRYANGEPLGIQSFIVP